MSLIRMAVASGGGREEEEELRWAAIERLPTYDRLSKSVLKQVLEDGTVKASEIDVKKIGIDQRGHLMGAILKAVEEDNERFLRRLRIRTDRVGIEIPKIEIRYEHLAVEGDVHVGGRALPTLVNATLNSIESILGAIKLAPSKKKKIHILKDANGIIKPSRITLLLGPPSAGKTTFLLALAGKLDHNLRKSGNITYCGHELSEFVPQRTCAYISQHDLHHGEMTVRETLDFSGRCLGVGTKYEMMAELSRREKEAGIKPDPEIDAFMKAISISGQKTSLVTDYVLKILGLDICSDIMVGDDMRRGISGGQKKRVTTGEMLVGPAQALLMDEISSGLDSSTTFQIIKYMRQIVHILDFITFFCTCEMALGLFRFISAVARTLTAAITLGSLTFLVVFVLGGFVVAKDDLETWLKWAYYISPMSYGSNAIAINEFLDKRWSEPNTDLRFNQSTVGKVLLQSRGFYTDEYWFWISVFIIMGFSVLFNLLFIAALTFLDSLVDSNTLPLDDDDNTNKNPSKINTSEGVDQDSQQTSTDGIVDNTPKKEMPFQHLSLVFNHMNYYVHMPAEVKDQGVEGDRLQLLRDVSGAFRPGVLTALVGVSGAGKTTLMDVLAGRKTGGRIEGSISISGYPKKQATFTRISGYCEQNDIHSPNLTVHESVLYSARLRLAADVKEHTRKMFVEEVLQLVELNPIRNSCVGLPGVNGLSTEQRKRLTIGVELVANPSIIFMDEPTSGLDARAAAVVMRTVRNTVDTGRTVVCTIHQPSIDIFEAFDELLLMKRGGRVVYAGKLGWQSHKLIEYFETIPGVPKIEEGQNPATWMLDIIGPATERQLKIDFADIYVTSSLYQRNEEVIKEASTPPPGSKDLKFRTEHSQPFVEQCKACFWKQYWSYWRNPQYNAVRFLMTIVIGLIFGLLFWNKGQQIKKQQDLSNLLGAIYAAIFFLGNTISSAVQTVVSIERTVFYREKAAGMYSVLPYVFAQVAIETIYVTIQSIIYTLLLYSMIGFQWTPAKFFWFSYFIFTGFVYFAVYGMMFIALTPGLEVGSLVASFFLNFWNLFSGFLIPRKLIPIWWRWYYWCSPVAWTIYGVVVSQFGDLSSQVEVPGLGFMTVKEYCKHNLGFDHHFLHIVAIMPLVFVVLFVFIFALALKFLNFQRR